MTFSQSEKAVDIFAIILLENVFSSRFLEDTVTVKYFHDGNAKKKQKQKKPTCFLNSTLQNYMLL